MSTVNNISVLIHTHFFLTNLAHPYPFYELNILYGFVFLFFLFHCIYFHELWHWIDLVTLVIIGLLRQWFTFYTQILSNNQTVSLCFFYLRCWVAFGWTSSVGESLLNGVPSYLTSYLSAMSCPCLVCMHFKLWFFFLFCFCLSFFLEFIDMCVWAATVHVYCVPGLFF